MKRRCCRRSTIGVESKSTRIQYMRMSNAQPRDALQGIMEMSNERFGYRSLYDLTTFDLNCADF